MRVIGVDEVGRGCWAGPVVAGAVFLDAPIARLRDSKKLTKLARQKLDAEIRLQALAIGLGWVEPAEIDKLGLTAAVRLAMERAMQELAIQSYDELVIDGNYNFLPAYKGSRCLIHADDLVPAVSAASIVAKVARDAYMNAAAAKYPGYFFERHVGYGTALHNTALQALGLCELHRRSFAPIRVLSETV